MGTGEKKTKITKGRRKSVSVGIIGYMDYHKNIIINTWYDGDEISLQNGIAIRGLNSFFTHNEIEMVGRKKGFKNIKSPKTRTEQLDGSQENRAKVYKNEGKEYHHIKIQTARGPMRILLHS